MASSFFRTGPLTMEILRTVTFVKKGLGNIWPFTRLQRCG